MAAYLFYTLVIYSFALYKNSTYRTYLTSYRKKNTLVIRQHCANFLIYYAYVYNKIFSNFPMCGDGPLRAPSSKLEKIVIY